VLPNQWPPQWAGPERLTPGRRSRSNSNSNNSVRLVMGSWSTSPRARVRMWDTTGCSLPPCPWPSLHPQSTRRLGTPVLPHTEQQQLACPHRVVRSCLTAMVACRLQARHSQPLPPLQMHWDKQLLRQPLAQAIWMMMHPGITAGTPRGAANLQSRSKLRRTPTDAAAAAAAASIVVGHQGSWPVVLCRGSMPMGCNMRELGLTMTRSTRGWWRLMPQLAMESPRAVGTGG
jgi:hypothetical protein